MITQRKYHHMLQRALGACTCPPVWFALYRSGLLGTLGAAKALNLQSVGCSSAPQVAAVATLPVMFGPPGAASVWRAAWLFISITLPWSCWLYHATAGTCSLLLRTRLPFLYSSESVGILALLACQALLSVGCVCVICLRLEFAQCALWQRVCLMCCCVLWWQAGCDTL